MSNTSASLSVNFDSMPPELIERPQWVLWRGPKVPYQASEPGRPASSTNPATWDCFDKVRQGYSASRDSGVGFVLSAKDGLACIDIDHNSGAEALELLRDVGCKFIERSPSGNGLHGWGLFTGDLPRKKGRYQGLDVEIYRDRRYMTVTGDVIEDGPLSPLSVAELSADLQKRTEEHGRGQKTTEVILSDPLSSSVGRFLPKAEGERNKQLFELVRYLKGTIPEAGKADLRPLVQEWHRLALPVIGTKDFSTTWTDFLRGWDKVRYPHGATLGAILEGVSSDPAPKGIELLGYGEKTVLLVKVCRRLSKHHGSSPFFLGARLAGELVNAHFTDANKMLVALVEDEVIDLVKKGAGTVASRYRWLWQDTADGARPGSH